MTSFNKKPHLTTSPSSDVEHQAQQLPHDQNDEQEFDYSTRSRWLRAAILGGNDGLVSTASLMMGIGAVKQDIRVMILWLCRSMQHGYIELAQVQRSKATLETTPEQDKDEEETEGLPNPVQAAAASAPAFSIGGMVPSLAASFIRDFKARIVAVVVAMTCALMVFGWLGAYLGKSPVMKSTSRVLIGEGG